MFIVTQGGSRARWNRHKKKVVADALPKSLGHLDCLHLQAAQGWLELGDHLEADKELDEITPQLRAHPDVLEVRWQVYAHAEKWKACVPL